MADYRTHVCRLFTRSGVPFQVETVQQAPDAPWLELHDMVDLDEVSGNPVVTVRLCFNGNARSTTPQPNTAEVALYAQYRGCVPCSRCPRWWGPYSFSRQKIPHRVQSNPSVAYGIGERCAMLNKEI